MKIILIAATATLLLSSCVSSMVTSHNPAHESTAVASIANDPAVERQQIALTEVPTMVLASLNKSYPKNIIQTMSKITVDKNVYYRFVISNNKKKKFPVVFNDKAVEEKNSDLK